MSDHSADALRNTDNNIADESDISVEVHSLTESTIEFDIKGIDASFANAFRRYVFAFTFHVELALKTRDSLCVCVPHYHFK